MTKGSIEWTKITERMKVVLVTGKYPDRWTGKPNSWWVAAGKLVTWGSRDAHRAQHWLMRRAEADKKRFKR
jgi:hypothetical protein